jgi:hypothetical protein
MGAFQTGFQIGSSAAQAALDRKEREERIKREEEERQLRLRQLQLGIAEAERRAENTRRADFIDAEIARGVGVDPSPGVVAQSPSGATAVAAPAATPVATPAGPAERSWMPLPVSPGAPPARRQADGQIDLGGQGVSSVLPSAMPAPWEEMTPEQQAQWYRENPRMAALTRGLQHLWLNGTGLGRLQRVVDPVGVGRAVAVADGDVGFFRPDGASTSRPAPSVAVIPSEMPAVTPVPSVQVAQAAAPTSPQPGGPVSSANPPQAEATRPKYSDKAMNLFRMAESARLRGDRAQFQSLFEKGQEQVVDDVANDFRKGYEGAEAQVGKAIEYLNATSPGITIGEPDPKTGIRQASIVQPDRKASFLKLSRADQAELYAAAQLMQTNPDRAYKMIAGVNKTLAEVVKTENEQARALLTANNQAAAYGANVRRDEATIANMERDDRRAQAAVTKSDKDAQAKADAAVALYRQRNPAATDAEFEAVRRGVITALPAAKVESTFTPNPYGGGGTATQRLPDGRMVITPIGSDGKPGNASTIDAPGAASAAGGAAGSGAARTPAASATNDDLKTITTARVEDFARSKGVTVEAVYKQLASVSGMTPEQLQAVVYANDARLKQQGAPTPPTASAMPTPQPAGTPQTPVTPAVDLGPSQVPARPTTSSPGAGAAAASRGIAGPSSQPAAAVSPSAPAAPAPIQMNFRDASIESVAAAVTVATGRRIQVHPDVKQKITLAADSLESTQQAFERFVQAVRKEGLVVLDMPNGGLLVAPKRKAEGSAGAR